MKGLLVKDICLLGEQKKLFIMYLILAVVLGFSMDSTFLVTYFPMIGVFLVLSTISLDHFDNGMAFLMTLPVNGKLYAVEKYVISLLITVSTWACAVALQFVMLGIKKEAFVAADTLAMDLVVIPVLMLVAALMIPMDLKFGTEKGRLVLFVIAGAAFALVMGGKAVLDLIGEKTGVDVPGTIAGLKAQPGGRIAAVVLLITALLLALSVKISIGIMQKKEY